MAYREMSDVTRIQYLRSDITIPSTVYEVAANIYAAYLGTEEAKSKTDKELMTKAVLDAIELAVTTEQILESAGTRGESGNINK
ncbi:MAG: hypothetical protein AAF384_03090 [Pseudomonadota bacterium]